MKHHAVTSWLCLLLLTIFIMGTAAPAQADTAGPVIDSIYPLDGQVLPGGPITIQARALDADIIPGPSVQLLVNGVKVPAVVSYDLISIDPVSETETFDYTHALITYRSVMSDNIYNIELSVKDSLGNLTTKQWSFEVASVPSFTQLTPAPRSTVDTTTPTISASISELGSTIDPASVRMTVNGTQAPSYYDPIIGQVTYTPVNPLPVDQEQTVVLTASDVNGHQSSIQWSFTVIYPNMPVPSTKADCLRCHTNMPQNHNMSDCAACHDTALRKIITTNPPPHFVANDCFACHYTNSHENGAIAGVTPWWPIDAKYSCEQCHSHSIETIAPKHLSTTTGNCSQCHSMVLEREHYRPGRVDASGNPFTCFTCHTSTNPLVQNAVAANNTACEACHTLANHGAVHNNPAYTTLPKDADMDCAACHISSVSDEHISGSFTSTKGYTCDTCHKSTRPEVLNAITSHNLNCEACHTDPVTGLPAVHTSSGPPLHNTIYADVKDMPCEQCHAGNIKEGHVGQPNPLANNSLMTCDTCHKSSNPVVVAAVVGNNTRCDACHATRHASVTHAFPAGYVINNPDNLNCAGCHPDSSLTELHVDKVTKAGVTMTCSTCHDSSAPDPVKTAIADRQSNCDACHTYPTVKHNPTHATNVYTTDTARPDAGSCVTCHSTMDLTTLHVGVVNSTTNTAMTCDTCHASTDARVVTAISTKSINSCEACHTIHEPKDVNAVHDSNTAFAAQADTDCATCHDRNVKLEHIDKSRTAGGAPFTCDTCHASTNANVINAISTNDTSCDACHAMPPVTHNPAHTASVFTSDSTRTDLATCTLCHVKALPGQHVGQVTSTGVTMDCNTCHSSSAPANVKAAVTAKNDNCEACHTIHPVKSAVTSHNSSGLWATTQDVNCASCHNRNVKTEHIDTAGRLDSSGQPVSCDTCHTSADPQVVSAIATGNDSCDACHTYPTVKHNPTHATNVYTTDTARTDDCSLCHVKAIRDEHVGKTRTAGGVMNCNTCHANTDTRVINAITTKQTDSCEACHTLHPVKDVTQLHDSVNFTNNTYTDPNMNCSSCHSRIVSTEHVNKTTETGVTMNCDTCHKSTRADVQAAITNNNLKCEACHTKVHTSPNPYHATTFVTNKTMACEKCHNAGSTAVDHAQYKTSAGAAITCDTCHKSTNTAVTNAIRTNNTGCDACHTARHSNVQGPHKTTYIPTASFNCINCHTATAIGYNLTASYHRVSGVTPTTTLLHGGSFISPWTTTSSVECRGCHGPNPTNGTYYGRLLKGNYTTNSGKSGYSGSTELCFICHNKSYYAAGYSGSYTGTGFKSSSRNLHTYSNHSSGGCQACHSLKPHSAGKQHFIAIRGTAEPNSRITNYTHATSYSWSNCSTSGCH